MSDLEREKSKSQQMEQEVLQLQNSEARLATACEEVHESHALLATEYDEMTVHLCEDFLPTCRRLLSDFNRSFETKAIEPR